MRLCKTAGRKRRQSALHQTCGALLPYSPKNTAPSIFAAHPHAVINTAPAKRGVQRASCPLAVGDTSSCGAHNAHAKRCINGIIITPIRIFRRPKESLGEAIPKYHAAGAPQHGRRKTGNCASSPQRCSRRDFSSGKIRSGGAHPSPQNDPRQFLPDIESARKICYTQRKTHKRSISP